MSNLTEVLHILEHTVQGLVNDWRYQARVNPLIYGWLVALYACMIIVGASGNLLVILAVARNRAMRTARNVYIVNLAISDLMLCLITMPLTLVEILYMTWQFGDYPAACPVAALLQATSIFVSTLSITAIALDRRQLIVCPHESPPSSKLIMSTVPVIWLAAFAMASPMAIWKTLETWTEFPDDLMNVVSGANFTVDNCPEVIVDEDYFTDPDLTINCKLAAEILPKWLNELQTCKEDFPPYGRLVYSSSSMIIQYLLPTITISVAYYQIYGQLKIRLNQKVRQLQINNTPAANGGPAIPNSNLIDRMENDIRKMRRTIYLLISMGLVFCVCWLPLNIFNTVLVFTEESRLNGEDTDKINTVSNLVRSKSEQQLCIIHAVCHVMGMLSACANPVIYGFLNENFHREFKELFGELKKKCFQLCACRKSPLESHLESAAMENPQQQIELDPLMGNGNKKPDNNGVNQTQNKVTGMI